MDSMKIHILNIMSALHSMYYIDLKNPSIVNNTVVHILQHFTAD